MAEDGVSDGDLAGMANAIRALAMDAVENAQSGHPGMPMGMADAASVLFARHLKFDAGAPDWADRDRFVLSAGHGSMLLYALGYLLGYEGMTMDAIRDFRQLGSKTAGHPEFGHAPGAETTTGPLGQGLANAVGMAIAEAHLAARFGADLVDHRTFAIAGDGCLMEGISQEAISLAGQLKLRKLIVLWDDNDISIDGPVSLADRTDQISRFEASGWRAVRVDGHDVAAVDEALARAREADRPTLIACRTTIGFGAPKKAGTAAAHGAPLGAEEIAGAREAIGWPHAPFEIPDEILNRWRRAGARGAKARKAWGERRDGHDHRAAFAAAMAGDYAKDLAGALGAHRKSLVDAPQKIATRKASELALNVINETVPETLGGSADLTGSNNTKTKNISLLTADDYAGRYIHYGVREHAMAAAMNGMALHGGVVPYGGTFLVFSDYARPAMRLAAIIGLRVVFVMTHDSIGLGEDGPTHQPVEHLAALRAIPNMSVYRPCDGVETAECWELALASLTAPSVIALTRQGLEQARLTHTDENLSARGAYVIAGEGEDYAATIIATGSEVGVALAARDELRQDNVAVRVVSAPSFEVFARRSESYRAEILGDKPRVGVEAAIRQGWDLFLRPEDGFVGMSSFGASGKGQALFDHFGITPAQVAGEVRSRVK